MLPSNFYKNVTWQHVQEKIILADLYYRFQENKKI